MKRKMNDDVKNNKESTYKLGGCTGKGFMPGQSGNVLGRPKKRPITEMYEKLLEENPEMVREQLKALITGRSAMAKVMFLKEAAERIEGKVAQPVEVNGEIAITLAERMKKAAERLQEEE